MRIQLRRASRLVSAVALVMALATSALAQQAPAPAPAPPPPVQPAPTEEAGIQFGLEGALIASRIKFDGSKSSVATAVGTLGGIWIAGHGEGRLGIVIEGTYTIRGADDRIGTGSVRVHYAQAPLLVRFDLIPRVVGKPHFYAIGGAAADIRIKARLNGEAANDQFRRFDVGIIGGAGIEFWRVAFEGRVNWGIYGIAPVTTGVPEAKNIGIEFLLRYRLK